MITDYFDRHLSAAWQSRSQKRFFVRKNHRDIAEGVILQRIAGVLIVITLALGVISALWFGKNIQTALQEIDNGKKIQSVLTIENSDLTTQRNQLLAQNNIEFMAQKIGLYPPSAKQVRTP
jgi:hypothetical protein